MEDNNEDCSLVYDATILEISLHKKANFEVIKKIVEIGGKELPSISTRSLLHLTIAEYGGNVVTSIVKLSLEVGGRDLLMLEEHWFPIHQNSGLFQFLNSNKPFMKFAHGNYEDRLHLANFILFRYSCFMVFPFRYLFLIFFHAHPSANSKKIREISFQEKKRPSESGESL